MNWHKKILTENETEMATNKILIITSTKNKTEMAENKQNINNNLN
jgi:hypothetical protein